MNISPKVLSIIPCEFIDKIDLSKIIHSVLSTDLKYQKSIFAEIKHYLYNWD